MSLFDSRHYLALCCHSLIFLTICHYLIIWIILYLCLQVSLLYYYDLISLSCHYLVIYIVKTWLGSLLYVRTYDIFTLEHMSLKCWSIWQLYVGTYEMNYLWVVAKTLNIRHVYVGTYDIYHVEHMPLIFWNIYNYNTYVDTHNA